MLRIQGRRSPMQRCRLRVGWIDGPGEPRPHRRRAAHRGRRLVYETSVVQAWAPRKSTSKQAQEPQRKPQAVIRVANRSRAVLALRGRVGAGSEVIEDLRAGAPAGQRGHHTRRSRVLSPCALETGTTPSPACGVDPTPAHPRSGGATTGRGAPLAVSSTSTEAVPRRWWRLSFTIPPTA